MLGSGAAITGMGCVTAYGVGVPELWRGLLANDPAPRSQRKRRDGSLGFSAESPTAEVLSLSAPASGTSRPTRPAMLARIAAEQAWTSSGIAAWAKIKLVSGCSSTLPVAVNIAVTVLSQPVPRFH